VHYGAGVRHALRLSIVVLAAGVGAAAAAAAAAPRSVSAPAPVSAVAFDGSLVAFSVGFSADDCDRVRLWNLATRGVPTRLRFVARDVDAPPPIVVGDGDGSTPGGLLPYAVDRDVVVLRANGARRFAWTAPARGVAVDARDGRVAVAQAGGRVTVLDAAGTMPRTAGRCAARARAPRPGSARAR
jgi:hypothetical protein